MISLQILKWFQNSVENSNVIKWVLRCYRWHFRLYLARFGILENIEGLQSHKTNNITESFDLFWEWWTGYFMDIKAHFIVCGWAWDSGPRFYVIFLQMDSQSTIIVSYQNTLHIYLNAGTVTLETTLDISKLLLIMDKIGQNKLLFFSDLFDHSFFNHN